MNFICPGIAKWVPKDPGYKKEILPDVVVVQPQHFQALKLSDERRNFLQTVVVQQELAH